MTEPAAHLAALSNSVHGVIYVSETARAACSSLRLAAHQQHFASRGAPNAGPFARLLGT